MARQPHGAASRRRRWAAERGSEIVGDPEGDWIWKGQTIVQAGPLVAVRALLREARVEEVVDQLEQPAPSCWPTRSRCNLG